MARGITFRDTGYSGPAVIVDSLKPGGAADKTGLIEPGDILVRCTATTLLDSDVPIAVGDGPPPRTKHRRIEFNCLGEDFDNVMAAVNSTGIVDSGFKHSKVRLEFMRDVTGDIDAFYGDRKRGHSAPSHPKTYHPVEKQKKVREEGEGSAADAPLQQEVAPSPPQRVSAVDPSSSGVQVAAGEEEDDDDTPPQRCKE